MGGKESERKGDGEVSRVIKETERKMGLERIHQKDSFGRWK